MRALDLFSGAAGGWALGLHRAGIETVAACEADPWRRAVYGRNFPSVRLYDDVRTLTGERVLADVGAVDLVAGSPPCQDASTANSKGKGIDGERTGLFWDALRLVRELRPRWVALENVPGIRTRGADRIIAELEALDYAVWPLVVGAVHAGAPHLRKRVWFVAYRQGDGRGQGRAGRPDPSGQGQSEQALHDAHAAPVLGPALAGREPNRADAGAAADAHGNALRHEPGRSGRTDGTGAAEPGDDAGHADRSNEAAQRGARGGAGEDACRTARNPDGAGLEIREGIGSDARAELPAPIRAIGQAWPDWNGGLADSRGVDDGLPRGVARAALAAYGDAVVPQIAEAIGRAIVELDGLRAAA